VQRVITVAPAPPRITTLDAGFRRSAFRRSRLSDGARVLVRGAITAPLRVSLRLTGPMRPRAERKTVVIAERGLDAGAFSETVRVPGALAKGRWRCALVTRGRVVDSVSILVG